MCVCKHTTIVDKYYVDYIIGKAINLIVNIIVQSSIIYDENIFDKLIAYFFSIEINR